MSGKDSVLPTGLTGSDYLSDGSPDSWVFTGGGLTKRELFAAMAMQGFLASGIVERLSMPPEKVATNAVMAARALLAALEAEE